MTESSIYWITRLDGLRDMEVVLLLVLGIGALLSGIAYLVREFEGTPADVWCLKGAVACASGTLLMGLALVFTPSTRDMLLIKGIPALVNSDLGKAIPKETEEVWKLAEDYLRSKFQPDKADGDDR